MITLGRAAYQTELRFNEYYGLSTDTNVTAQEIADKFNNLIQNLINAGIMVSGN